VKTLALLVRRPALTRAAFREHYERVHAPLALSVMSGLQRYVRHHVTEELHGVGGFDVVSTFEYRDVAAMQGVVARLASPAGDAILRDELLFMDKSRNRFFPVREASERGARERSAPLQAIALLRRQERQSPADFASEFAARGLNDLADAVTDLRWLMHHEAIPGAATELYDVAVQLHAGAAKGLLAWCAERDRECSRVVLVRVEECETQLPPGGVP
jgi:uncharacterized protein (TIGR02118 family)